MEQDEYVYLYKMGDDFYRFEAHSDAEAERVKEYALLHFQDRLGDEFSREKLRGPIRVVFKTKDLKRLHSTFKRESEYENQKSQ